ncbi:unnamed protein product [Kuraishia capsulata CBS 1993]|uniref:PCI domain-containing protein n=1 Tax=Kuraishia capsulata CBS 1993 TaxID=1382522 RepID=W6MI21_9ASCO|nr:uncharacterized protein KUCA_T00001995001 [Kuraishia capsulata CBS 1993]CDK26024.1 unnamed protein product [Kuraishia capsulata CBS 1993]
MSVPSIEDARRAVKTKDYSKAEEIYNDLLSAKSVSDKINQSKENAILELGQMYRDTDNKESLVALISQSEAILSTFAKSKTSKIVRSLIDLVESLPGGEEVLDLTIKVTSDCIEWAVKEKRSFLRQALQLRLASLYYKKKTYTEALAIINNLLKEFKKLDDKSSLVEVQLLEAETYLALKNFAKSRASLTSARTSANSIYCPTQLQAQLDLMSGILHAEDKDYNTAFSYFFESFESFQLHTEDEKTIKVLKYMLLCKVMLGLVADVKTILASKNITKFVENKDIDAMKAVATAHSNRSLGEFEGCLKQYSAELTQDPIIRSHLNELYDSLFQQNLLKLIEPYSCIEIQHISSMIGLSTKVIESKLSHMILDKVFYGVLDQGNGWLIVYDEPQVDEGYDLSLSVIKNMSSVVELLYEKASFLN